MLQILQNTAAISCSQAAAILGCFETQDVSQALQILLMSIHDVFNIPTFEHVAMECVNACGNSALDDAYEQLHCPSAISLAHNPSGHYELDLTNQVCTLCHTHCDCCKHWTALSIGHPHATNMTSQSAYKFNTGLQQRLCWVGLMQKPEHKQLFNRMVTSLQVHRIMAVKIRNADLACSALHRSVLATSRPVVCRNIRLGSNDSHTSTAFDSLSEALLQPSGNGLYASEGRTAYRLPTEGVLSLDIAQNSLSCAPRRQMFTSRQEKAAMERTQVFKEVVTLGWQDSPFMPAEDSTGWRRNSAQALQLIALVAQVCSGRHNLTQSKANELLDAEHEILVRFCCFHGLSTGKGVFHWLTGHQAPVLIISLK